MSNTRPAVLFLCTHNAGRSQMAMGFFRHVGGDRADVYSGGSEPADEINPAAIAAMAEKGIDIAAQQPQQWTMDMLQAVDVVITMGCGDSCPILPGRGLRRMGSRRPGRPIARRDTTDPRRDRTASTHAAPPVRSECRARRMTL
jgi:protein-tyrosine-phosphatase